jgi:hypothetical protein
MIVVSRAITYAASLLFFTCLAAQSWVAPQELTAFSPDEIVRGLRSGTDTDKKHLAELLDIKVPRWTRVGATEDILCLVYQSVGVDYVVLQKPGPQAVLQIDASGSCWHTYLVVLEKIEGGSWMHVQTLPLFGKNRKLEFTFPSLINAHEHEIVAKKYAVDSGTGIFQTNMIIIKLVGNRLEVVFNEPEIVVFAIPTTRGEEPASTDQEQESEFSFVPGGEDSTSLKQILEKQVIRDHDTTIVRWRIFHWAPELRRFQPVPWSP